MNELMLIEMMSELDPKFLNNKYIENDMKRFHFFNLFHMKTKDKEYDFPFLEQESKDNNLIYFNKEAVDEENQEIDNQNNSLFDIGIYKKKMKGIYKILSGIATAIFVILGIVVFIVKKQKRSGFIRAFKTT